MKPTNRENDSYLEYGVEDQAMEEYYEEHIMEEVEAGHQGDSSESDDSDDSEDEDAPITITGEDGSTEKTKPKRGLTRMFKLKNACGSTGKKKRARIDDLGRFKGKYRSNFVSFLGDLVRDKVGLSVLNWKQVKQDKRDYLWNEITV